MEDDHIIGLSDVTGGGAISLEPGGQFELSGAPLDTSTRPARADGASRAGARSRAPLGIGFLGLGMTPIWTRAEIPVMPKARYRIMTNYMPKVGTLGLDMMYRTCTVQTNLDFSSEADMVKKLRVSLALQPIATALFANSPFTDGKPNGFLSFRSEIWRDTDNARAGMLPFVFEGLRLRALCRLCARRPDVFRQARRRLYRRRGFAFRDLFGGQFRSGRASSRPFRLGEPRLDALSRRCASSAISKCAAPMAGREAAAGASGLLGRPPLRRRPRRRLGPGEGLERGRRQALRDEVPQQALKAEVAGRGARDIARDCVALAHQGLRQRRRLDGEGRDEFTFS